MCRPFVYRVADAPATAHLFAADTFSLGRVHQRIDSAATVAISFRERTVVDLLRLRSQVGRDLALSALRRYLMTNPVGRSPELGSPAGLCSLDALHLATALSVRDEIGAFVTYDQRLADAARDRGLKCRAASLTIDSSAKGCP